MEILESEIKGCYIISHDKYNDNRGFFQEIFNENLFKSLNFFPMQVNNSFNRKNVFRGIHLAPFRKLVTCVSGSIVDICVDLRKESPTYLKNIKILLDNSNKQVLIPANCGHAFLSKKNKTSVIYMQDSYYDPSVEISISYKDPKIFLNIKEKDLILSEKDKNSNYFSL